MAENNGINSIPYANGVKHAVKVRFCSIIIHTKTPKLPECKLFDCKMFLFSLSIECRGFDMCPTYACISPHMKYNVINDVSIRYYFNLECATFMPCCYAFQNFAERNVNE